MIYFLEYDIGNESNRFYSLQREIDRSSKRYSLEMIPQGRTLKVLDIGCATGLNSNSIKKFGHKVIGIEYSNVALREYSNKGYNCIQANIAVNLPFLENVFDVVFASEVIEHIYDTDLLLEEAYRVLKSGGVIILSTPNSSFWVYKLLFVIGKTVNDLQHPGHVRFFTKELIKKHFISAGFQNIAISGRHMYLILGDKIVNLLNSVSTRFGFEKEFRIRTGKHFYHKSRFAVKASRFWADTFIITAEKVE